MDNQFKRLVDAAFPEAIRLRRAIHAHPELSGDERRTAKLVFDYLSGLGLKPRYHVDKTGVAARMSNGAGKTVVLRADMDALPIREETGLPFASRNEGVMHACGHDIHTACLLVAAKTLIRMKDSWKGEIVLLFQPFEEVAPGGALRMITEKAFPDNADAVFGLHVSIDHDAGQVGVKPGQDYSGVLDFEVTITGRGGHGAAPHATIDPIVCASAAIMELQAVVSRECPSYEPAVLSVGAFHAGTKNNIIPDKASFCGTIRTLSDAGQARLQRRFQEVVSGVARSFRAHAAIAFERSYPPGRNDEQLTSRACGVLSRLLGKNAVVMRTNATMYADDFSYFQRKAPGLYVHLGVRRPGLKKPAGIHSARFTPDERSLKTGIAVHTGLAIDILSCR